MDMLKINKVKRITILAHSFDVVYDKSTNGAWFQFHEHKISIGIASITKNPEYTLSMISHEVMEAILAMMGGRYEDPRQEYVYHFHFDHQTFENAIQLHTELMLKFIQQ